MLAGDCGSKVPNDRRVLLPYNCKPLHRKQRKVFVFLNLAKRKQLAKSSNNAPLVSGSA